MNPPEHFSSLFRIKSLLLVSPFSLFFNALWAQRAPASIALDIALDTLSKTLSGTEEIRLVNTADTALTEVFLHTWANAYRDRESDLTRVRLENRKSDLYFAPAQDRGYLKIEHFASRCPYSGATLANEQRDILRVQLSKPWRPGDTLELHFEIQVKIPNARFTGYGFSARGYRLKYWYLIPAVYRDGKWLTQTEKGFDDLYALPTDYELHIQIPKELLPASDLKSLSPGHFHSRAHKPFTLSLFPASAYHLYRIQRPSGKPISIRFDYGPPDSLKADTTKRILKRVVNFLENALGSYPFQDLLLTKKDYKSQRFYGLENIKIDLINREISLFKPTFRWEMSLFKQLAYRYLDEALFADRRQHNWLYAGLKTYLQMRYINAFYKAVKLTGNAENFKILWIRPLKLLHLTKLSLNDRYRLLYLYFARMGFDQAIDTPLDSLSSLNILAISAVKTALGLRFLNDYVGHDCINQAIKRFYTQNRQRNTSVLHFEKTLKAYTRKDLHWFFYDYLQTRQKIDYKLLKYRETNNTYRIRIKNKSTFSPPFKITAYRGDTLIKGHWYSGLKHRGSVYFPKGDYTRLALNDHYIVPEINNRNNFIQTRGLFKNKRKLQFKPFGDIEDPQYNQIFFLPEFEFNNYDKLILILSLHNQAILKKPFSYKLSPAFSTGTHSLSGRTSFSYDFFPAFGRFRRIRLGVEFKRLHYERNLPYTKLSPSLVFTLRKSYARSDRRQTLMLRHVYVNRKTDSHSSRQLHTYRRLNVFNLRYTYDDPKLLNSFRFTFDNQIGAEFVKVFAALRYQKYTDWHQQIGIRFFAGSFLYNNTREGFFDFGLDHVKDYLVDYSLLGRSEDSGVFYQQFVFGQGGFKSDLRRSANQWMVALNLDFQIWRAIGVYSDLGAFKNRYFKPEFAYDTGFKLRLIPDFLAFYFPLQSSQDFEPKRGDYLRRIRFTLTWNLQKAIQYIQRGFY